MMYCSPEIDVVANQHTGMHQQAGSLKAVLPSATEDVVSHSGSRLRHWASSEPDALPGVFAQPAEGMPSPQQHQLHGLQKH